MRLWVEVNGSHFYRVNLTEFAAWKSNKTIRYNRKYESISSVLIAMSAVRFRAANKSLLLFVSSPQDVAIV